MIWKVEFDDRALKELRNLDSPVQKRILLFLRRRIATAEDPKRFGKPLKGTKFALWRYRIGPYRLVCMIEKDRMIVLVVAVGHRKEIYR